MLLKVFQTAEIVKAATRKVLAQANRYIDVARIGLASGRGTEQRNALHASGAELLFMPLQGAYDLIALHGLILPTPFRPVKAPVNSNICGGLRVDEREPFCRAVLFKSGTRWR